MKDNGINPHDKNFFFFFLHFFCFLFLFFCLFVVVVVFITILHCPLREIGIALPGYKAMQPQEQRYPFLSVCAVFSTLPIPVGVCSIFNATHSCRCVQYFQRYPFLSVCAVFSTLPIPVGVCSIFNATHSCRCVQYFQRHPFLSVCAVFSTPPIPVGVCSIFMCPTNGMAASVWIFNVYTDVDACDCTRGLYGHREGVCTGWRNSLAHQGLEPVSVLCLDFQSDVLPTELFRPSTYPSLGE